MSHNPRAKDRYGLGWSGPKHQVINKIDGDYDWAVVRIDKGDWLYQANSNPYEWDDSRTVTYGEGTRHVAVGRKAKLERDNDGEYEVRAYKND